MQQQDDNQIFALEAILFALGEPVGHNRLCELLEVDEFVLQILLGNLEVKLQNESGFMLWQSEGKYQLVTKPEFAPLLKKALDMHRDVPLTPAGFEVLSIIAYRQPVTKAYVEQTRGVDCSGVMATLVQKGLIAEAGRLELPGRPLLYATTDLFLRCFGIADISELPDLTKIEVEAGVFKEMPLSGDGSQLTLDTKDSVIE